MSTHDRSRTSGRGSGKRSTSGPCLLEARDLTLFTPDGLKLFRTPGFRLNKGDFLHIQGDNGTGKSSAVSAFLGQYRHYSGEIGRFYDPSKVAYLPQMGNTQHLLPLSLGEVIALNSFADPASAASIRLLSEQELSKAWNTSSGGERQKALLTKAFSADAELVILDEPFNHLDSRARSKVAQLIAKQSRHKAIIVVSHDAPLLAEQATITLSTSPKASRRTSSRPARRRVSGSKAGSESSRQQNARGRGTRTKSKASPRRDRDGGFYP